MKPVGYQQPTCVCVKMEFVVGTLLDSVYCVPNYTFREMQA